MNTKFKTAVLGALVAGSLVLSAGPVLARDDWQWRHENHGWQDRRNDRRDLRRDYAELARARRQREYLRRHHASRGRIAQQNQHIWDLWNDIRGDRTDLRRDRHGWFDPDSDRD